jgi:NADH-quinone oxidoreductase subunit L
MTVPLIILAVLSIVGAGWKGPADGWFARFSAPYDVAAIAGEFEIGHGEVVLAEDAHGDPVSAHAADPHAADTHATDAHADPHEAEAAHGATAAHGDEHAAADGHGGHDDHHGHLAHLAHQRAMVMSIGIALLGILLSWLTYVARKIKAERVQAALPGVHNVLQKMYFFDDFYAATVYPAVLGLARLSGNFDKYVVDGIVNGCGYLTRFVSWLIGIFDLYVIDGLVNGLGYLMQGLGETFRRLQTGRLQTYIIYVCLSVLIIVFVYRFIFVSGAM